MYNNKEDVDKHVDNLKSNLSTEEFNKEVFSVACLYFKVEDYASCKQYVEQYLTQSDNNAAAYKLLGQALQMLGQKEKALEQYKTSIDTDPTQTNTILDICELLADDEFSFDPGRANYWCEKAEATFPLHPVTSKLREKLFSISIPDPEALLCGAVKDITGNDAYNALGSVENAELNKDNLIYSNTQLLIEVREADITQVEVNRIDIDEKYSAKENVSVLGRSGLDQQSLEKIEQDIKNLQKKDSTISDFMEQTKTWIDENRKLGNQIMSTITSIMRSTNDQFKQVMISVDHVKDQIGECRKECKDVGHLKKQIAELNKDVNNLKMAFQLVSRNRPSPAVSSMLTIPTVPPIPAVPITVSPPAVPVQTSKPAGSDTKEISQSLPVPSDTSVLSTSIPQIHIAGTAHNYQIPMPPSNVTKVMALPILNLPTTASTLASLSTSLLTKWNQSSLFKAQAPFVTTANGSVKSYKSDGNELDNSIVDGVFNISSPNLILNKSRTLSERSNTSVDNYDPCPDFKSIIPLPAEVKVTTGEEDEAPIFSYRAKLFRFVDKQWKERGIGEMKLLKHKISGKVRVLMRREQIHKICANHIITSEMEIKPMKNETKAYFWVANDFAEGTVVLEKFCVRFKTADIAHQFYEVFENTRQETLKSETPDNKDHMESWKINTEHLNIPVKTTESNISPPIKANISSFTFSATPAFKHFKPVDKDAKTLVATEQTGTKINVFSGLTFKTNTNQATDSGDSSVILANKDLARMNNSDTVEEFEPNVEFKPVIPLPALVDQKTGEENETVLFEHRAKLLRFDAVNKEWKERGLGNMKLLVHKENIQKVRLLMRREQIMKVCCNHAVTKEMVFQKMPNIDKAVTWGARDFSEGELISETFCLRFKTAQTCDEFIAAVKLAQSKIKNESKAAKEEQKAAKQGFQIGFGDVFKPKAGSWHCDTCNTYNLEQFLKCACCEQPKPQRSENETSSTGSKSLIKLTSDDTPKFTFRIPQQTAIIAHTKGETSVSTVPLATGWGDEFIPKNGTWECKKCSVRNEIDMVICSACSSAKDPNTIKQVSNTLFSLNTSGVKFSFSIPDVLVNEQNTTAMSTRAANLFAGTGAYKFSFGLTSAAQDNASNSLKTNVIFGPAKTCADVMEPINPINIKSHEETVNTSVAATKPALLPTPIVHSAGTLSKEGGSYDFIFEPKTPAKGKSPMKSHKSPNAEGGDGSDGNDYTSEDEGHHIHFSPVIPMPDKVEVVTGEENEMELYAYRAKLFRFISGELKERGIGVVKILRHRDTKKLRVVMRREQVLKICLNHALTSDIIYTPKDDKTWLFAANDFSDGELSLQRFCLRFKTKDIALDFKGAADKARGEKNVSGDLKDLDTSNKETHEFDDVDVVFVNEILDTKEEKEKAKELMLPENFYTYKNKEPCSGCRGCSDEEDSKTDSLSTKEFSSVPCSTPPKLSTFTVHSPSSSLYGTPTNLDKTTDNSMFRTHLGSIGSYTKTTTPEINNTVSENDASNKENAFTQKASVSSGLSEHTNLFSTPKVTSMSIWTPSAKNLLAASTLKTVTTSSNDKQKVDPKPLFGNTNLSNSIFSSNNNSTFDFGTGNSGTSMNKSIFRSSGVNNPAAEVSKQTEEKSIFGIQNQQPVNHFSNTNQDSIFGPEALKNNQTSLGSSVFGSTETSVFSRTAQNSAFSGKSIFGTVTNPTAQFPIGYNKDNKETEDAVSNGSSDKKYDVAEAVVGTPSKIDSNLSFAALSSTASGFQKKHNFQWQGAGQQLSGTAQNAGGKDADKSKTEGDGGDNVTTSVGGDEEYDPHYEPIVPLPEKNVVTTGEEEKLFGERCKLYRYDDKTREWKKRGVGEMKVLYHPGKKSYRLLLRREQVHKAVLNMLLFMDLELLPMKNSDRAWTWAGRNYAEAAGEQETLAVRFKSTDLATAFHDKVVECVRKLQAAAAQAIREQKETNEKTVGSIAPLRLPKHLEDSARADNVMSTDTAKIVASSTRDPQVQESKSNGDTKTQALTEVFKQVHFQEPAEEPEGEEEDDDEDHDDDDDEDGYDPKDYDGYYNEDDESRLYYACEGEVVVRQGNIKTLCEHGHVQVLYDQEIYSPKILVTDSTTGEILADMLIYTDTEFQMSDDTCSWSGTDYTSHDPVYKTVTVTFHDSQTALMFYDSCETSKASTYTSTDRET